MVWKCFPEDDFFHRKSPHPESFFFFLKMGPRHLQWQESILSEYIAGGRGEKVTWCAQFKQWQDPKYFVLWNADISKITIHRKSSRSNLGRIYSNLFLRRAGHCGDNTENGVNLTSTSAPNLKHSKKKVQRIHQTHDDPRGPRKRKTKQNSIVVVTTIQKSMCSGCIGGSWCVHCLQWSEHQKKGVNTKLPAGPHSTSFKW